MESNTGMRAYVQMEYTADGLSPAEVERLVTRAGFRREGIYYVVEGDMVERLSELHDALRGTGVSYILVPSPSPTERWSGTIRDVAQHWREDGLIDDEALDLLERDPQAFREAAYRTAGAAIERLAAMRERELAERRETIARNGKRDDVIVMLRSTGGMTADQVGEALDAPEQEVFDVLASMVQDGSVLAEQVGHTIVYRLAEKVIRRR
jgi:hypothetical protein